MYVPFISTRSLARRKGGGGKGGGGGGGGSGGGSGGKSGGASSVSAPNLGNGRSSATAYGAGSVAPFTIPAGQPFAGRSAGGGSRSQIYGTSVYGSGYPGIASSSRGVGGRGLPFLFWPVVWGGAIGGSTAYLHDSSEYGQPTNTTRPGGAMTQARFASNTTNTAFHVLADNTTVSSLIASITANCTSFDLSTSSSSTSPTPYSGSSTDPQPEQAIQYYRASSVALTLDGYNNSVALASDSNAPPAPLPSGIDTILLGCLNDTIGAAVPLVSAAFPRIGGPSDSGTLSLLTLSLVIVWRLL